MATTQKSKLATENYKEGRRTHIMNHFGNKAINYVDSEEIYWQNQEFGNFMEAQNSHEYIE